MGKHEAWIRMLIMCLAVLSMVVVAVSLDHVIAGLVVKPLERLLPIIRQVREHLHEAFPTADLAADGSEVVGEEYDEVSAFEEVVSKMTLMVQLSQKQSLDATAEGMAGAEWISGMATPTSTHIADGMQFGMKRRASRGSSPDVSALEAMGIGIDDVNSWTFDVLSLTKPQLTGVTGWILVNNVDLQLTPGTQVIANFLSCIEQEYYDDCQYHNWKHAVDVHHGVFRVCVLNRVLDFSTRVDIYALLLAAISHDVGHPGFNNVFLVQTYHELALRYNDLSPLENMHCSTMFGIISSKPDANVFGAMSREQRKEARSVCIETILHTDNAHHFAMVKELQMFYLANSDTFEGRSGEFPTPAELELFRQTSNRRLAFCSLLHGADISNACKPWNICQAWADRVLGEFFAQGDKEKLLGIPVQMLNNRDTVNKPSSQVAFIEFFVYPFNLAHVRIFSPLWELSENLRRNLQRWHAFRKAEEQEAAMRQVQTMSDQLLTLTQQAQARERPKRPRDNRGSERDPTSPESDDSIDRLRAAADCLPSPLRSPAAPNMESPAFNMEPSSPEVSDFTAHSSRMYSTKPSEPSPSPNALCPTEACSEGLVHD